MAIVLIAKEPGNAASLLEWSWQLAKYRHEALIVLLPRRAADRTVEDIALSAESETADPVLNVLREQGLEYEQEALSNPDLSPLIIRTVAGPDVQPLVLSEVERIQPSLLISPARWNKNGEERTLGQYLFNRVHCPMMALSGGLSVKPRNLLVPLDLTRHSREALKLVVDLSEATLAEITLVHVEAPNMEEGEAVGQRILESLMAEYDMLSAARIKSRVVIAQNLQDGIHEIAPEYDGVVMGAPRQGSFGRILFGALPDQLRRGPDARFMAVVRAAEPWQRRLQALADRLLHLWVPQMNRDDRIQVYERIKTGSQWGFDFMMLTALSTSIAAFGLIQSSAAVVIGAMLVAPLMTPMLGAGLALLQGNRNLLIDALRAVALGFALALAIGCLVGLLSPVKVLTSEMQARGAPTLLDLSVALLAGFAAAYAYARPHLLAALPGVAIAAALVPPIATTGVCLALGEVGVAAGAALLFGTNVVAIIVGATAAFYCFGLRGRERSKGWENRAIQGLVIGVFVLAVPLSAFLWSLAQETPSGLTQTARDVVAEHGYRFIYLHRQDDVVEIKIQGAEKAPPDLQSVLTETTRKQFGSHIRLRIITELAVEVGDSS